VKIKNGKQTVLAPYTNIGQCSKKSIEIETVDRLLYIFDKEMKKSLKSKESYE